MDWISFLCDPMSRMIVAIYVVIHPGGGMCMKLNTRGITQAYYVILFETPPEIPKNDCFLNLKG